MNPQTVATLFDRMTAAAENAPSDDNSPSSLARLCWDALTDEGRTRVWERFMGKALTPDDVE